MGTREKQILSAINARASPAAKLTRRAIRVFTDDAEIAAMIERDHRAESAKYDPDYNPDGSLK